MNIHRRVARRVAGMLRSLARNPAPVRMGWPALSTIPLLRRRKTDALPWHRDGPPDAWKR